MSLFKFKIGLSLGSGGIRGLAHISLIKILEENHIPIDFIAGTSIGALVGGLYAAKKDINSVENFLVSLSRKKLLSLFMNPSINQGLINPEKIKDFLDEYLKGISFSELKIPLICCATNIRNGEVVELRTGNVSQAIVASGCVPLVFKPVVLGNKLLVDGGVSLPVPVLPLKKMGIDFIIASNLNKDFFVDEKNYFGLKKIFNTSISILLHSLAEANSQLADFVFYPKVNHSGQDLFIDKKEKEEIIKENEELLKKEIPRLLKELRKKKRKSRLFKFLGI